MKKILILVCMIVLSFGFVSCSKDNDGGNSYMYEVLLEYNGQEILSPGTGTWFLVKLIKNGKEVDPSVVTISTFKDSNVGNLRIWNGSGIDIQSNETITRKYGEIAGCQFGAMSASGSGKFGLIATYKDVTDKITFRTA